MRKCKDKLPKQLNTQSNVKTLNNSEENAQSTSPIQLLFWAHSANVSPEFYLVAKEGGKERNKFFFILHERLLYLYLFENTKIANEIFK